MCVWTEPTSSVSNVIFYKAFIALKEFIKVSRPNFAVDFKEESVTCNHAPCYVFVATWAVADLKKENG